ncbi:MAG: hypothetical protein AAF368_15530, partial [Planctomycetota bacterium]
MTSTLLLPLLTLPILGQRAPEATLDVTREGFLQRSLPTAQEAWTAGFKTVSVGRAGDTRSTTPTEPCAENGMYNLDHGRGLFEHIEGRAEGTAQSWTLHERPRGDLA